MSKKIKIISICLIVLTFVFGILCFSNIFSDSRKYYEEQLDKTHQSLVDNLDFQDELNGYGDRYSDELDLTESSEEVLRDWMWDCQQAINEYEQKALIFGLLAVGCGVTTIVFIIVNKKRKV